MFSFLPPRLVLLIRYGGMKKRDLDANAFMLRYRSNFLGLQPHLPSLKQELQRVRITFLAPSPLPKVCRLLVQKQIGSAIMQYGLS